MSKYKHTVTAEEEGLTINQILKANFKFSQRFRTKMKFQKLVDLDGTPQPGYIKPAAGSLIEVRLPVEENSFEPEDIPFGILYEDDDLLIVNKQPGLTTHPTKGHPDHTLANGVMKYIVDTGQQFKIRFANRLDMDTSGILIVAKSANAQSNISEQMRRNEVVKKYTAIVHGVIEKDQFTIDLPVGRPIDERVERAVLPVELGGKNAVTDVRVIERFDEHTLVHLTLHTGRTHQIRVHLKHIGHPIIGDHLYGGDAPDLIGRQALHAHYISLSHPMTGEKLEIEAALPDDMQQALNEIKIKQQS